MKLSQLAAKPQLIQMSIDDEATIEEFGEAIEFWIHDRQDMDTYMKLASVEESNVTNLANILSQLVLDEKGNKILIDGVLLTPNVMLKVINKVVDNLGNAQSQTMKK